MNSYVLAALLWYLTGVGSLLLMTWFNDRKLDSGVSITVDDVIQGFTFALAGAILLIPVLYYTYEQFIAPNIPRINKDRVVWRSRKAKTSIILYGDKKKK